MTSSIHPSPSANWQRPFIEKRLPECAGRAWVCSLKDFDWRAARFDGGRLGDLVGQMGWFFPAHRASDDVTALLHLVDHCVDGRRTVLRSLVGTASRPTFRIVATGAPFETKDLLKRRGYRWDAAKKVWSREVAETEWTDEIRWVERHVYGGRRQPDVEMVTWRTRYARRSDA